MISLAAMVARDRRARGVRLNYPEAVATPGLHADHPALAAIRARAGDLPDGDLGVVTRLQPEPGDAVLCARYLGASAERGLAFLRDAWRLLRPPLLGREAVTPRIWST